MRISDWSSTCALPISVLGICGARALTRYHFPAKGGVAALIMLPLVLPEIIIAISLLVVLLQLGFDLSLFSVTLGHILMAVPFSIAVLSSSFEGFDRSLEEASDRKSTRLNSSH